MSEKFSLMWNDHRSNWEKTLSEFRNDTAFSDVTLISDDKVKFSAHKILLSSCSDMLKVILKENNHRNSLIYLSGMSSDDIRLILDYIYLGEAKLYQEQLDSFLKSSKKLEIDGLFDLDANDEKKEDVGDGQSEENEILLDSSLVITDYENFEEDKTEKTENLNNQCKLCDGSFSKFSNLTRHIRKIHTDPPSDEGKIDVSLMTPGEIKDKLKELYKKSNGFWICLACDYKNVQSGKLKRHIETHVHGLSYTCTLCYKKYGTKNRLNSHVGKVHTGSPAEQRDVGKVEEQKLPEETKDFIVKVNYDSDVLPITSTDLNRSQSDDAKIDVTSLTSEEIEEQKKKMYQKMDNVWRCLACDYISMSSMSSGVRRHIEGCHLVDGQSHNCKFCDKEFGKKTSLMKHIQRKH